MHASGAEDRADSYERLEFLGDSILGFVVSKALFDRYPESFEGELTRLRASVVSRQGCAAAAREIGLDRMFAERFELTDDLRRSDRLLAELIEAGIAAVMLEHGLEKVVPSILAAFETQIEKALHEPPDHKTRLQEEAARLDWTVCYAVVSAEGPPHDRRYTCEVLVDGRRLGVGSGRSKKEAQQSAAAEALRALPPAPDLS